MFYILGLQICNSCKYTVEKTTVFLYYDGLSKNMKTINSRLFVYAKPEIPTNSMMSQSRNDALQPVSILK